MKENVAAPVYKTKIICRGVPLLWPRDVSLLSNVGTNFADKRRSNGRYNSLAN
jgi:hypothetical protein